MILLDIITPDNDFDKEMEANKDRKEMIYNLLEILKKSMVKNYFAQ